MAARLASILGTSASPDSCGRLGSHSARRGNMPAISCSSRRQLSSRRRRMSSKSLRSSGSRLRVAQGFARRDRVQVVGRIGDAAPETALRSDGQRVREIAVERIDGLDAQARRAVLEAPAARAPRARAPRPRARASAHRPASATSISPSSAFCTRSRISPAALRVKVMASTCSGSSTVVSSRR